MKTHIHSTRERRLIGFNQPGPGGLLSENFDPEAQYKNALPTHMTGTYADELQESQKVDKHANAFLPARLETHTSAYDRLEQDQAFYQRQMNHVMAALRTYEKKFTQEDRQQGKEAAAQWKEFKQALNTLLSRRNDSIFVSLQEIDGLHQKAEQALTALETILKRQDTKYEKNLTYQERAVGKQWEKCSKEGINGYTLRTADGLPEPVSLLSIPQVPHRFIDERTGESKADFEVPNDKGVRGFGMKYLYVKNDLYNEDLPLLVLENKGKTLIMRGLRTNGTDDPQAMRYEKLNTPTIDAQVSKIDIAGYADPSNTDRSKNIANAIAEMNDEYADLPPAARTIFWEQQRSALAGPVKERVESIVRFDEDTKEFVPVNVEPAIVEAPIQSPTSLADADPTTNLNKLRSALMQAEIDARDGTPRSTVAAIHAIDAILEHATTHPDLADATEVSAIKQRKIEYVARLKTFKAAGIPPDANAERVLDQLRKFCDEVDKRSSQVIERETKDLARMEADHKATGWLHRLGEVTTLSGYRGHWRGVTNSFDTMKEMPKYKIINMQNIRRDYLSKAQNELSFPVEKQDITKIINALGVVERTVRTLSKANSSGIDIVDDTDKLIDATRDIVITAASTLLAPLGGARVVGGGLKTLARAGGVIGTKVGFADSATRNIIAVNTGTKTRDKAVRDTIRDTGIGAAGGLILGGAFGAAGRVLSKLRGRPPTPPPSAETGVITTPPRGPTPGPTEVTVRSATQPNSVTPHVEPPSSGAGPKFGPNAGPKSSPNTGPKGGPTTAENAANQPKKSWFDRMTMRFKWPWKWERSWTYGPSKPKIGPIEKANPPPDTAGKTSPSTTNVPQEVHTPLTIEELTQRYVNNPPEAEMTIQKFLNLKPGATLTEVKEVTKKLLSKVHHDVVSNQTDATRTTQKYLNDILDGIRRGKRLRPDSKIGDIEYYRPETPLDLAP